MSSLGALMIAGAAGLVVSAALGGSLAARSRVAGISIAATASLTLAAAGVVAVFDERLVWRPFSWFALGRGEVQVDNLAGFFLIVTGLVSAALFLATRTQGPRTAHALRPLLMLCVVGVIVVANVFEFLIVYELTVVAIYALISIRHEDPRAERAAALMLILAKLGGGAVMAGMVLLSVHAGSFSFE